MQNYTRSSLDLFFRRLQDRLSFKGGYGNAKLKAKNNKLNKINYKIFISQIFIFQLLTKAVLSPKIEKKDKKPRIELMYYFKTLFNKEIYKVIYLLLNLHKSSINTPCPFPQSRP